MAEHPVETKTTPAMPVPVPPVFQTALSTPSEGKAGESASLRSRRLIPFSLLAQGHNPEQIGNTLGGFKEYVIRDYLKDLPGEMGASNHVELLEQALENGDLKLQDLVRKDSNPSLGLSKIEDPVDREIVKALTRGADYPAIESELGLSKEDILKRIMDIKNKTGAANNFQLVVFALESRRRHLEVAKNKGLENPEIDIFKPLSLTQLQVEILSLYAQGYRDNEIASKVKIGQRQVKRNLEELSENLGVETIVQAIDKVAELGEIKLNLREDFDPAFIDKLSSIETRILKDGIIEGRATIGEMEAWPDMEEVDVREILRGIRTKAKAKSNIQAGVLYQLAKKQGADEAIA